jgi:hypothetical protein
MNDIADRPGKVAKSDRMERLAPWIAGIVLALPVIIARYPPMTDMPHYEALVSILRHKNDASFFPPGLYVYNFGHPNQLFYFVAWPLSYVVPVPWACKLCIAATVVAISAAAGRLAAHLGASRWTALIVAPVALGWTFFWGLGTNLVGLAALLAMLPVLDRACEEPSGKNALKGVGAMVLLYFAHEAMMVTACVAVAIFAFVHLIRWDGIKRMVLRVLPAVAATAMWYAQIRYQKQLMSKAHFAFGTTHLPFKQNLVSLPGVLLGTHGQAAVYIVFGLGVLTAAVFAVSALRADEEKIPWKKPRQLLHRWRFQLFGLALLIAYFAMPFTINGATLVNQRFLAPAYAVLVLACAAGSALSAPRLAKIFATVMPIGSLLIVWPEFADADRSYKELDTLLPLIEQNSSLCQLELGTSTVNRVFSAASGGTRAVAVRGGRICYTFTDSTISPVMVNRDYQWNESLERLLFDTYKFRPSHDFTLYRYVVAHSPGGAIADVAIRAMEPDAKLVGRTGEWLLFESRLPTRPLLSPDVPLPDPKPPTLRKRMRLAFEALVKEQIDVTGKVPAWALPPQAASAEHKE